MTLAPRWIVFALGLALIAAAQAIARHDVDEFSAGLPLPQRAAADAIRDLAGGRFAVLP